MKRFRILIIAPYLSFQETAAPVIQEFPTVDFAAYRQEGQGRPLDF